MKYPILVWFYSIRQILKKTNRSLWYTPIIIKTNFKDNKNKMQNNNEDFSVTVVESEKDMSNGKCLLLSHTFLCLYIFVYVFIKVRAIIVIVRIIV